MANDFSKSSLSDLQVQGNPWVSQKHDVLWLWCFRDYKSWIDISDVELYSVGNDPGAWRYVGNDLRDLEEMHYGLKGSDWRSMVWTSVHLGPVVRRLISANPRLNFNLVFFIPLFKCLVGIVFRVLYRASNNHILDKKNSTEFSFKTVKSEIRFHTNPGLS